MIFIDDGDGAHRTSSMDLTHTFHPHSQLTTFVLLIRSLQNEMLSSLCRNFSSACSVRTMSTASSPELVSVLKLNMLQDNPGAVKKVCALYSTSDVFCGLVSLFVASNTRP